MGSTGANQKDTQEVQASRSGVREQQAPVEGAREAFIAAYLQKRRLAG